MLADLPCRWAEPKHRADLYSNRPNNNRPGAVSSDGCFKQLLVRRWTDSLCWGCWMTTVCLCLTEWRRRSLLSGEQVEHISEGSTHLLSARSGRHWDALWWTPWVWIISSLFLTLSPRTPPYQRISGACVCLLSWNTNRHSQSRICCVLKLFPTKVRLQPLNVTFYRSKYSTEWTKTTSAQSQHYAHYEFVCDLTKKIIWQKGSENSYMKSM